MRCGLELQTDTTKFHVEQDCVIYKAYQNFTATKGTCMVRFKVIRRDTFEFESLICLLLLLLLFLAIVPKHIWSDPLLSGFLAWLCLFPFPFLVPMIFWVVFFSPFSCLESVV